MDHLYLLIREKTKKQEGSHRVAAEIVAGMIRGSKYWNKYSAKFQFYSIDFLA
jgi:hypothetical protein